MRHEHTSRTKTIRERLGLTQQQLANYLGVSRAHLGMHEQNRRPLPLDASGKLAKMVLHQASKPADLKEWLHAPPGSIHKPQYVKAVKKAIWLKTKQLVKAEKVWQTTTKKFEQAAHMAHYCNHNQPASDAEKGDKLWHELHSLRAKLHLVKFALPIQLLQQLEVDSLQYYIDNAGKLLQQLEGDAE